MKTNKKEVKVEKEKKVVKKKDDKKSNSDGKIKKELIIGIVIGIVLLFALVLVLVFSGDKENNNNEKKDNNEQTENNEDTGNNNEEVDYGVSDESTIIRLYGMSKEDALNLVKSNFNSDNFEFSVEISPSVTYIVTVKNTVTNSLYKYEVDPLTKDWYEI